MTVIEEFAKKWIGEGLFPILYPKTAADIIAVLDAADEIEMTAADRGDTRLAADIMTERACSMLSRVSDPVVRRRAIIAVIDAPKSGRNRPATVDRVRDALRKARRDIGMEQNIFGGTDTDTMWQWDGNWLHLGRHKIFCGDSNSPEFIDACAQASPPAAFAFADPPYGAGVADWDMGFDWKHDWLEKVASVVAVTPGVVSIQDFFAKTEMAYRRSVACHIKNGRARGKMGFGNWIEVLIFGTGSIYSGAQDHIEVVSRSRENWEAVHPGRKPVELMTWLVDKFSKPGDVVIDPFIGSGTTLMACDRLGRTCIGAEINRDFLLGAGKRWAHENTV